ncbi:hypothetical protein E2C01_046336 [Portunus trituberculatus]|uniref:Uncharacterized protein n=1 Tax=Portunus trituberculatus TaxID=210409 RepID=A0A5B7G4H4_PORTR|nr:hypothetical protein [Portunus trituberculatus]
MVITRTDHRCLQVLIPLLLQHNGLTTIQVMGPCILRLGLQGAMAHSLGSATLNQILCNDASLESSTRRG